MLALMFGLSVASLASAADGGLSEARLEQVTTGPGLTSAPLPKTGARIGTLDLVSEFRPSVQTSLQFGYRHERFRSADFANDGVGPNTLANVILLGQDSPDHRVYAVLVSLRHQF